ncbi:hypothetical protein DYB32_005040 [Aphanomyces invadans]|uniref:Uncharacterized protein n=1 Tax=Aphanomyces invadans TaxID=157072 RepID=A0A418AVS5_9STRA|nr:hypothetical protein DYB32_005040 [Aphanomyces invadans]
MVHLRTLAIETAMRIVHQVEMDPEATSTAWSLHKVLAGGAIRIYKGTAINEDGHTADTRAKTQYCGHMTVEASLDEAIEVFRTDTPRRAAAHRRRFGPNHLANTTQDKITLYSALEPTAAGEYAAITWQAYAAVPRVLRRILPPRDECVLEVRLQEIPTSLNLFIHAI